MLFFLKTKGIVFIFLFVKFLLKFLLFYFRFIATTHFEPTDARAAFPCFDEPQLKAKFKLSMIREPNYISLFNMPLFNTQDYDNGLKMDIFNETVTMSTYLVAFVVCDYKNITKTTKRGVTVSLYQSPPPL